MKWKNNGGGDFVQPPTGTFLARCVKLVDLGTQTGEYQGKATSRRQVIIGWELPDELMETGDAAGKPFLVTAFYTQSLSDKAKLRHDLVAWRGREFTPVELEGFEAKNILGAPCMLTLTMNDKEKVRVTSVAGVPRSMKGKVPKQVNPSMLFSLELDEFDEAVYQGLSDGIRKMIDSSPEMKLIRNGGGGKVVRQDYGDVDFHDEEDDGGGYDDGGEAPDDIPFD